MLQKFQHHQAMSHEFLTSLHSQVIGSAEAKPVVKVERKAEMGNVPAVEAEGVELAAKDEKHRTIGVSMSPKLQARAAARAREVGLSFSRYVQWCLEAELDGSTLEARFRGKGESAKAHGVGAGTGRGIQGILQGKGKSEAR